MTNIIDKNHRAFKFIGGQKVDDIDFDEIWHMVDEYVLANQTDFALNPWHRPNIKYHIASVSGPLIKLLYDLNIPYLKNANAELIEAFFYYIITLGRRYFEFICDTKKFSDIQSIWESQLFIEK